MAKDRVAVVLRFEGPTVMQAVGAGFIIGAICMFMVMMVVGRVLDPPMSERQYLEQQWAPR